MPTHKFTVTLEVTVSDYDLLRTDRMVDDYYSDLANGSWSVRYCDLPSSTFTVDTVTYEGDD
jgi:hypothetical protein